MGKWEVQLTVENATDRTLKLLENKIPWGKTSSAFTETIAPGASAKYYVYSPAGNSSGIEFTLIFQDVAPAGSNAYGNVRIFLDIPVKGKTNTLTISKVGILNYSANPDSIPSGAHDFFGMITISKG